MKKWIIYLFPLVVDVIIGLNMFLGRHSLASRGYGEQVVASIVLCFGIGYIISSLLMIRIVKPRLAKLQMLVSLAGMVALSVALANTQNLLAMQVLYSIFPFLASLFFNAYQIYVLGISNQDHRPLSTTAGHFVLAWSIGFALGPLISSQLVAFFDWSNVYYLSAILAVLLGLLLFTFNPGSSQGSAAKKVLPKDGLADQATIEPVAQQDQRVLAIQPAQERSLVLPAWIGLLVGLTVWNVVLIYWPVQAAAASIPASLRGSAESSAALAQALSALGLTYLASWLRKPSWILGLGLFGLAGLLYLSQLENITWFFIGALSYGVYMGSMFSLAVYHAMADERKAVFRVALNETLIGCSFLLAFPLSAWFHPEGAPISLSYLLLAAFLALGLLAQFILASRLVHKEIPQEVAAQQIAD
jgi:hypothetical protein